MHGEEFLLCSTKRSQGVEPEKKKPRQVKHYRTLKIKSHTNHRRPTQQTSHRRLKKPKLLPVSVAKSRSEFHYSPTSTPFNGMVAE